MKTKKHLALLIFIFTFLHFETLFADSTSHKEYFKAVKEIQKIPAGATPVLECNLTEEKDVIKLLDPKDLESIFGGKPKIYKTGITTHYGESVKIYKGDFSNSGNIEYLFMVEGGSLATDTVMGVYKLAEGHLINLHFDNIVIKNILGKKDLSSFYMWMPKPLAFVQNNKTYLRYMNYPTTENKYDRTQLLVCTYLWKGKEFKLMGASNCIGYKNSLD